jgi:aspartyl protease family protein
MPDQRGMGWWLGLCLSLASGVVVAADIRVLALFKGRAVVEINGKQETLKLGQPGRSGAVLQAADSQSATVLIDGQEIKLKLGEHIGSSYKPSSDSTLVQVFPDANGMYFTQGTINGQGVEFLVDTGATLVVMNIREAERLGIDYQDGERAQASTAGGVVDTYNLELPNVAVGNIRLSGVAASVVMGESPPQILLGNSFLSRLEMRRQGQVLELVHKR